MSNQGRNPGWAGPVMTVIGLDAVTNETAWGFADARAGVYDAIAAVSGGRDDFVFLAAFRGRREPAWNYQDLARPIPPSRAAGAAPAYSKPVAFPRNHPAVFTVVALDEVLGDVHLFESYAGSAAEAAQEILDGDPVWLPQSILAGRHESLLLYQEWGLRIMPPLLGLSAPDRPDRQAGAA